MNGSISIYNNATITAAGVASDGSIQNNFVETDISGSTTWSTAVINLLISNGSTISRAAERVDIYYAVTPFSGQTVPLALLSCAKFFTLQLPSAANANAQFVSPIFPVTGDTLYTWLVYSPWAYPRTIVANISGVECIGSLTAGTNSSSSSAMYIYTGADASSITPTDPTLPAIAYSANGTGSIYTWTTPAGPWV